MKPGDLAWWQVRDPVRTPIQPARVPVSVVRMRGKQADVVVMPVAGCLLDPDRLPGARRTVSLAKLSPRTQGDG